MILSAIVRGGGLFRSLMIIPWAVPAVVSGIIWKWMFSPDFGVISDLLMKAGLIQAPLSIYSNPSLAMVGVIIADSWTRIPFMGIILLAALLSIPGEIHEAARVDGAGAANRFFYVTLPLVKGPLLVGLLITTIFSFRTIDIIIPLTAGGPGKSDVCFWLLHLGPDRQEPEFRTRRRGQRHPVSHNRGDCPDFCVPPEKIAALQVRRMKKDFQNEQKFQKSPLVPLFQRGKFASLN